MGREISDYLAEARRILVFTGAGVSTGSGIPDYRGPRGLWKTQSPVYYRDFMTSESERTRYWSQKLAGWEAFRNARPTAVHRAVVRLEEAGKLLAVVTQNIDGLHRKAGTSGRLLVELHGTMDEVECQSCGARHQPERWFRRFADTGRTPRCRCGGFLKPATISFGQSLRAADLQRAFAAADGADLVVSLGSTLEVTPAADVPLRAARRGVPYLVINRGPTGHDGLPLVTLRLDGDVQELFPSAVRRALGEG
ncbi:MAG: SIR2 family NAD-dependent protein deacylase [Spirochaetota bacterium]